GVGSVVLVAIWVERSADIVIGLLGILKAGGVYVPLDPEYPKARLSYMLEDTGAPLLLTQQSVLVRLPEYSGRVVQVDGEGAAIAQESEANPANVVCGENLAYVIYTSGSTGKPKGSLLTHQGTCNLVHAQAQVYNRATNRHVLQFSSFSFDASLYEMVMALLSGATLFM